MWMCILYVCNSTVTVYVYKLCMLCANITCVQGYIKINVSYNGTKVIIRDNFDLG